MSKRRIFYDETGVEQTSFVWTGEQPPEITVAQRDAITPQEGMEYRVGTIGLQVYRSGAWRTLTDSGRIVNDLTTGGAEAPLSAEQGKALQDTKAPIQDTDTWVLTTSFTGNADPIASNLARFTHSKLIGSGMTQSSGVFTFPRTGIWEVKFSIYMEGGTTYAGGGIRVITDASGTPVSTLRATGYATPNSTAYSAEAIFPALEVTNVNDIKVSFFTDTVGSPTILGFSTSFRTGMVFKRIADL